MQVVSESSMTTFPVEVLQGSDSTELAVVMKNYSIYVISPKDLEDIVYMTSGRYPMRESAGARRCFDSHCKDTH